MDMEQLLARLEKPVLIFNIKNDALVSEADAQQIQSWSNSQVSWVDVVGSDHLLSSRKATEKVALDIVRWMSELV